MSEEKPIILCARTESLPQEMVADDSVRILGACGHEVWLSRGGMQIHLGMGARLMCTECGGRRMEQEEKPHQMMAVPGALAEIEKTLGKEARDYSEQMAKITGIETFG